MLGGVPAPGSAIRITVSATRSASCSQGCHRVIDGQLSWNHATEGAAARSRLPIRGTPEVRGTGDDRLGLARWTGCDWLIAVRGFLLSISEDGSTLGGRDSLTGSWRCGLIKYSGSMFDALLPSLSRMCPNSCAKPRAEAVFVITTMLLNAAPGAGSGDRWHAIRIRMPKGSRGGSNGTNIKDSDPARKLKISVSAREHRNLFCCTVAHLGVYLQDVVTSQ
jgi:hypothetical protein